jgi:hypothetical protein
MGFLSKHRYGKTAATVWTMWILIWTCSFINHVVHSKSRRPDVSLHGPDTQASNMEIACIRSAVRTTDAMVQTRQALIWKLHAVKVRLSGRQMLWFGHGLNQERISAKFGKPIAQLSVRMPYVYRPDGA